MNTQLYMIRHAESPFVHGEERTRGLSEDGFQAAKKVADRLDSEEIHCIVSSTYVRAKQTVQYLAERKNLPILEFEDLRERPSTSKPDIYKMTFSNGHLLDVERLWGLNSEV